MKIFIENITFEIYSKKDLNLFSDFYESHFSKSEKYKKYSKEQLLSLNPKSQPECNPFEAFSARRGNKETSKNRNLRKKKKKKEEYNANKAQSKKSTASYDQQRCIEFNPFLHQVPGLLKRTKYESDAHFMPQYYKDKLLARKDFLKANYSIYKQDDFTFLTFSECINQLNAIYYDKVNFKPRYDTQWWTLHKSIEAGDTYFSTLSKNKKTIHQLTFPTQKFEPAIEPTIFSYLNRTDFLNGPNEIVINTEVYESTANLTDPILHLKEKFDPLFIKLKERYKLNQENATATRFHTLQQMLDKLDNDFTAELIYNQQVVSRYITRYLKDPRNTFNANLEPNMRNELTEMVRKASR
jgi:hypothetical protein